MSAEELRRVYIVKQAIGRVITQKKTAELLGVSYRQTKRLVKRVREERERDHPQVEGQEREQEDTEEVKARGGTSWAGQDIEEDGG